MLGGKPEPAQSMHYSFQPLDIIEFIISHVFNLSILSNLLYHMYSSIPQRDLFG